jgi:hypothetical protein
VTTVRDETSLAISHTLRSMFSFQRTICVDFIALSCALLKRLK